jgi:hypothetical protein
LIAAMCVVVLLALHDWLIHSQHLWRPGAGPLAVSTMFFLLHYSAPMVFLAIGLIMTGRFRPGAERIRGAQRPVGGARRGQAVGAASQLCAHARNWKTEQAVSEERERIYRDLHDDVGAKTAVSGLSRCDARWRPIWRVRPCRICAMSCRAPGQKVFELDEVVADWRAECEKRLSEAGIRLDWQRTGEQGDLRLTQPQALNLGRILREAISNVIRHAGRHFGEHRAGPYRRPAEPVDSRRRGAVAPSRAAVAPGVACAIWKCALSGSAAASAVIPRRAVAASSG